MMITRSNFCYKSSIRKSSDFVKVWGCISVCTLRDRVKISRISAGWNLFSIILMDHEKKILYENIANIVKSPQRNFVCLFVCLKKENSFLTCFLNHLGFVVSKMTFWLNDFLDRLHIKQQQIECFSRQMNGWIIFQSQIKQSFCSTSSAFVFSSVYLEQLNSR